MVTAIEPILRTQLIDRRQKLTRAATTLDRPAELTRLLHEVDEALQRMDDGVYGLCDVCHDPIEAERLLANPLARVCLGDLTVTEQRALEDDLQLAAQIQTTLLPQPSQTIDGWEFAYHYEPAGLVSGDYCDLIKGEDNSLHFILGDVSGKGVAASMLMAHLHAMFRTLTSINLPLAQLMERASRVFCESTLPTQYATLVCGRANTEGEVEICNAGHLPPLMVQNGSVTSIEATGLPLGVFCSESFTVTRLQMRKGDSLLLYTDGLSESQDVSGNEYGATRLSSLLTKSDGMSTQSIISMCRSELSAFSNGNSPRDDLTLMSIRRVR